MSATEQYIAKLNSLKPGDLGLLRTHAGRDLDHTVDGFDLFTGLWWPLRQKSPRAPRREVAWLIAKLYAECPLEDIRSAGLAGQLRKCWLQLDADNKDRFQKRFDAMLALPVRRIEPALHWALLNTADLPKPVLDWVALTDDLSFWDEPTRLNWAKEFLHIEGGE